MGAHIEIRPLSAADALACDAIVASLVYHFANEEGRAEAAAKVRTQPGLVAVVDGAVAGFLTVERHFDHAAEISWMAVHADHRRRGAGHLLVEGPVGAPSRGVPRAGDNQEYSSGLLVRAPRSVTMSPPCILPNRSAS